MSSAVGSISGSLSERAPSLSSAIKASAQQLQTAAQAVASSSAVQQLHDRLSGSHELHFAVERVQAAVASARGADRLALLQHWVALLPAKLPPLTLNDCMLEQSDMAAGAAYTVFDSNTRARVRKKTAGDASLVLREPVASVL